MVFGRRHEAEQDDVVTLRLSRREIREMDAGDLGTFVASAAARRTVIAEFEPGPRHTIQDFLLGEVTWEELADCEARTSLRSR